MPKNNSSQTALGVAMTRLIEQYQPENLRLYTDPIVKSLFPKLIQILMRFQGFRNWIMRMTDKPTKGIYGVQICRTKYIDDLLRSAINDGFQQVIILGAGLDTRAYRIPGINDIHVIEVDLPGIQQFKKQQIFKVLGKDPNNTTYVPIDFNSQSLEQVLTNKIVNFDQPIFFIWEGVTQYISAEAVSNTLAFVGKAATSNRIVFTYVLKSVIDKTSNIEGSNNIVDFMNKRKSNWIFGLDPDTIKDYLDQFKLKLIEDVGTSYYQENYLKPIGRQLNVSEIERIIFAKNDEAKV